jgi:hypothetical protein
VSSAALFRAGPRACRLRRARCRAAAYFTLGPCHAGFWGHGGACPEGQLCLSGHAQGIGRGLGSNSVITPAGEADLTGAAQLSALMTAHQSTGTSQLTMTCRGCGSWFRQRYEHRPIPDDRGRRESGGSWSTPMSWLAFWTIARSAAGSQNRRAGAAACTVRSSRRGQAPCSSRPARSRARTGDQGPLTTDMRMVTNAPSTNRAAA